MTIVENSSVNSIPPCSITAAHPKFEAAPVRRKIAAVLAISLGTMVTSIDNGVVSLALPTLSHDLHVAPSQAVLVVTIFQLLLIMTVLPLAALGDRIGHRRLYLCGLGLFMGATTLCLIAHTLPQLLIVRAFQGLGAAATFSVSAVLIRNIYPKARLGSGLALNTIVAATSASLAPSVGGFLLSVASWPWLFAATVPLAMLALVAGARTLPPTPRTARSYDILGAILCAGMFGLAVTSAAAAVEGAALWKYAGLAVFAIMLSVLFVRREKRKADPMLPVDLLATPLVAFGSVGALLANLCTTCLLLTLPFRFQQGYGYSPGEVGLLLASWPIAMMVVAPTSGLLSDRVPPTWLGIGGMTLATAGLIALALLPALAPTHLDIMWRVALTAAGFGLYHSPNARQIIGSVPLHRTAAAGALTQTTRMAGQIAGSTIAAGLLAIGAGAGPAAAALGALLALATASCSVATLLHKPETRQEA